MQTVSSTFLNAILAPERRIRAKVDISLFDNDALAPAATASATSTHTPPDYSGGSTLPEAPFRALNAFDGRSETGRHFAAAGPATYPASDLYPVPDDGVGGWWSDIVADGSGNVSPTQYLTIDYTSNKTIATVTVAADAYLGYPVDYIIEHSTNGSSWSTFATITGNTNSVNRTSLAPGITVSARYMRIGVTKISRVNYQPVILELSNGWNISTDDALQDRVLSIDISRESFFEDESSLPIGNYSAAQCSIELDNTDGAFYQRNLSSPYYGYLTPNKKIAVHFGLYTGINPDGTTTDPAADQVGVNKGYTFLPMGIFYTLGFNAGLGSSKVRIECWDRVKRFQEIKSDGSAVLEALTISELMEEIVTNHLNLDPSEYDIQDTREIIKFAWFDTEACWNHIKELATGETGYVFVDETNKLVFKDRYFYWSTRIAPNASLGNATTYASGLNYRYVDYVGGVRAGDRIFINRGNTSGTEDSLIVSSVDYTLNKITFTTTYSQSSVVGQYVYASKDGIHSPLVTTLTTSNIKDADDVFSLDKMKNKIEVKSSPLTVIVDEVTGLPKALDVWKDEDAFRLAPAGTSWTYSLPTVGGVAPIPPTVTVTDTNIVAVNFSNKPIINGVYSMGTYPISVAIDVQELNSSGGLVGGIVVDPAYIQVSWLNPDGSTAPYAWGGHLKLRNVEGTGKRYSIVAIYVSGYQLESKSVQHFEASDQESIDTYGEKTFSLESPYIAQAEQAQSIANNLLNQFKNPSNVSIKIDQPLRGMFHLQVGDRIAIIADESGLNNQSMNNHYYIVRQEFSFDGTLSSTLECVPAN